MVVEDSNPMANEKTSDVDRDTSNEDNNLESLNRMLLNSPFNVEHMYEVDVNIEKTNNEVNLEAYGHTIGDIDIEAFDDYRIGNMGVDEGIRKNEHDVGVHSDTDSYSDKGSVDDVENVTDDEEMLSNKLDALNFKRNKRTLGIDFSENIQNEEATSFLCATPMSGVHIDTIGEDMDDVGLENDEAWKNDTRDMEENQSSDEESCDGNHIPNYSSDEDDWAFGYDESRKRNGNSNIVSPLIRKMPGKPKRKRIREVGENKKKSVKTNCVNTEGESNSVSKASKKGTTIKCSICKQEGHNKTRCQQRSMEDTTTKVKQKRTKKPNGEARNSHQGGANMRDEITQHVDQATMTKAVSSFQEAVGNSQETIRNLQGVEQFRGIPTFVRRGKSFIHGSSLSKKANRRN